MGLNPLAFRSGVPRPRAPQSQPTPVRDAASRRPKFPQWCTTKPVTVGIEFRTSHATCIFTGRSGRPPCSLAAGSLHGKSTCRETPADHSGPALGCTALYNTWPPPLQECPPSVKTLPKPPPPGTVHRSIGSAFQFAVTVPLLCRNQPCGRFQVKKYCASNEFTSPSVPPVNDQAFSNNTPTVSGFG